MSALYENTQGYDIFKMCGEGVCRYYVHTQFDNTSSYCLLHGGESECGLSSHPCYDKMRECLKHLQFP